MPRKRDYAREKARRIERELAAPVREEERVIQDRIIEALTALGMLVERRGENQGRRGDNHTTGEPDLRVSFRRLTFGIEVKRDALEDVRKSQIDWHRAHSKHVPYYVVCSHHQAVEVATMQMRGVGSVLTGAWDCRVEPFHAWVRLT